MPSHRPMQDTSGVISTKAEAVALSIPWKPLGQVGQLWCCTFFCPEAPLTLAVPWRWQDLSCTGLALIPVLLMTITSQSLSFTPGQ